MGYTVEVRVVGGDLVTAMTQMRTWLDHQRIEPDAFRQSADGAGVAFRVDFKLESEAGQFAKAFGGRLVGLPAGQADDPAAWPGGGEDRSAPPPTGGGAGGAPEDERPA